MRILSSGQMSWVDRETTSRYGLPSLLLMENAGSGVVREMERHFGGLQGSRVLVVCGKGNNGGDGLVVARHLHLGGVATQVVLTARPESLKGDAGANLEVARKMGVPIEWIVEEGDWSDRLQSRLDPARTDILVDALLGTGVRLPLKGFMAEVVARLRRFPRVVAVDLPSGLDCDCLGNPPGDMSAPVSELTVTFTAPKPAHVFAPAARFSGNWVVVPIGSPPELVGESGSRLHQVTPAEAAATLQSFAREPEAHKGHFGHVLAVAGSTGKTGAAAMAAQAALACGGGLVTLAVPAPCQPVVAGQLLEVMTEPLAATPGGAFSTKAFDYSRVENLLQGKTVVVLGPGLGRESETVQFARRFLDDCPLPVVLDADGINACRGALDLLGRKEQILVLTPHPGEFARLLGISTRDLQEKRIELARDFAMERGLYLVLKGHQTLLASPSGQVYLNSSGNPAMAKGGSGDVLTGIVAGLMAQWFSMPATRDRRGTDDLESVITLAVFIHGLAGDLAQEIRGDQSVMASDLTGFTAEALRRIREASPGFGAGRASCSRPPQTAPTR